jgi:hypothetical protein
LIVTVRPATVTVPVRGNVDVLAAMVSVTVPPPLPLAGDRVIHVALDVAVHAQLAVVVTVTVEAPLVLGAEMVNGDTL